MKTINDLIKNDPNISQEFKDMFGESREEMLAGDAQSKLSAKLKDMTIKQKWDIIDHSTISSQVLNNYLDAIIEEHPYIYNQYFGE